jgi:cell division protein ZapA
MNSKTTPINVTILGKEYRIACTPDEQDGLLQSARQLDAQMRKIRDSGKVSGTDRIAVMAALNIAHELQAVEVKNRELEHYLSESLQKMTNKIENVLDISETR